MCERCITNARDRRILYLPKLSRFSTRFDAVHTSVRMSLCMHFCVIRMNDETSSSHERLYAQSYSSLTVVSLPFSLRCCVLVV